MKQPEKEKEKEKGEVSGPRLEPIPAVPVKRTRD
jgi:hypothetical protein